MGKVWVQPLCISQMPCLIFPGHRLGSWALGQPVVSPWNPFYARVVRIGLCYLHRIKLFKPCSIDSIGPVLYGFLADWHSRACDIACRSDRAPIAIKIPLHPHGGQSLWLVDPLNDPAPGPSAAWRFPLVLPQLDADFANRPLLLLLLLLGWRLRRPSLILGILRWPIPRRVHWPALDSPRFGRLRWPVTIGLARFAIAVFLGVTFFVALGCQDVLGKDQEGGGANQGGLHRLGCWFLR